MHVRIELIIIANSRSWYAQCIKYFLSSLNTRLTDNNLMIMLAVPSFRCVSPSRSCSTPTTSGFSRAQSPRSTSKIHRRTSSQIDSVIKTISLDVASTSHWSRMDIHNNVLSRGHRCSCIGRCRFHVVHGRHRVHRVRRVPRVAARCRNVMI